MTHFNHDWDTAKTPAVPVSVGDRYYAQDLNDDFNYLKHLPYEVFLQGRSRGVMIAPSDTWNNDTNSLTLSGGFGIILQDCVELDPNEDFVIPPKTHSSSRYERISFADATLTIPTGTTMRYIVATPTKRSLLQRAKTLLTEQYASRIRYDGIITIQDTAPTTGQILVGLCCNKEYCLLIDNDPNQCKNNIILKKWFGQNKITQDFVTALQSYYSTSIETIETVIAINVANGRDVGIGIGTFNNCTITINTVNSKGINNGTFNNCTIAIGTVDDGGFGINNGTFNNCIITINTVNGLRGINNGTFNNCTIAIETITKDGINGGTFNDCIITINTVNNNNGNGTSGGTFNDCTIAINTVSSGHGTNSGTFNNCTIAIKTVNGYGINGGTFNDCTITIKTVNSGGFGINNGRSVRLYLTQITSNAITDLSNTGGKLNVLNDTILHAS